MSFAFHMSITVVGLMLFQPSSALALDDARLNQQLMRLDPDTRLEQTCDTEVMFRINREQKAFSVDKVIAYTFRAPTAEDNVIKAPGAVFRSRGEWYHLAYECKTGPRHLDAQSLVYTIGQKVSKSQWASHYLYD